MGLNISEIEKARNILNDIIKSTKKLSDLNQIKTLVEEEDDFALFLHETVYGSSLYDKLIEMIEPVVSGLYSELDSLNIYTYNYLNRIYDEEVNK